MTVDEALQVVAAACSRMMGTLEDHRQAQAALKVLTDELHPTPTGNGATAEKATK